MKVVWAPEAIADLEAIWTFVMTENPRAAVRLDAAFAKAAQALKRFPHIGRPSAVAGTRETLPHPSYRLIYEIDGETVWVLALVHTARQWPPLEG